MLMILSLELMWFCKIIRQSLLIFFMKKKMKFYFERWDLIPGNYHCIDKKVNNMTFDSNIANYKQFSISLYLYLYDIFSMKCFDSWFQCMEILWMYQCKFTLFLHFYIENILFFLKFKFLKNAICKLSTLYLYGEWLSNDITLICKYQVVFYYNFVRTQYFIS